MNEKASESRDEEDGSPAETTLFEEGLIDDAPPPLDEGVGRGPPPLPPRDAPPPPPPPPEPAPEPAPEPPPAVRGPISEGANLDGGWTLVRRVPLGLLGDTWIARDGERGFKRTLRLLPTDRVREIGLGPVSATRHIRKLHFLEWETLGEGAKGTILQVAKSRIPTDHLDLSSETAAARLHDLGHLLLRLHAAGWSANLLCPQSVGYGVGASAQVPVFLDAGLDLRGLALPDRGEDDERAAAGRAWWAPEQIERLRQGRRAGFAPASDTWFFCLAEISRRAGRRAAPAGATPQKVRQRALALLEKLDVSSGARSQLHDGLSPDPGARPELADVLAALEGVPPSRAAAARAKPPRRRAAPARDAAPAPAPASDGAPASAPRGARPAGGLSRGVVVAGIVAILLLGGSAWALGFLSPTGSPVTRRASWDALRKVRTGLASRRQEHASRLSPAASSWDALARRLRDLYGQTWVGWVAIDTAQGVAAPADLQRLSGALARLEQDLEAARATTPWPPPGSIDRETRDLHELNGEIAGYNEWVVRTQSATGDRSPPPGAEALALIPDLTPEMREVPSVSRIRARLLLSEGVLLSRGSGASERAEGTQKLRNAVALDHDLLEAKWRLYEVLKATDVAEAIRLLEAVRDDGPTISQRVAASPLPFSSERSEALRALVARAEDEARGG